MASGKKRDTLRGMRFGVAGMAFSPDGRTLATCDDNTTAVLLWDVSPEQ